VAVQDHDRVWHEVFDMQHGQDSKHPELTDFCDSIKDIVFILIKIAILIKTGIQN
jgi:hypothetical protein